MLHPSGVPTHHQHRGRPARQIHHLPSGLLSPKRRHLHHHHRPIKYSVMSRRPGKCPHPNRVGCEAWPASRHERESPTQPTQPSCQEDTTSRWKASETRHTQSMSKTEAIPSLLKDWIADLWLILQDNAVPSLPGRLTLTAEAARKLISKCDGLPEEFKNFFVQLLDTFLGYRLCSWDASFVTSRARQLAVDCHKLPDVYKEWFDWLLVLLQLPDGHTWPEQLDRVRFKARELLAGPPGVPDIWATRFVGLLDLIQKWHSWTWDDISDELIDTTAHWLVTNVSPSQPCRYQTWLGELFTLALCKQPSYPKMQLLEGLASWLHEMLLRVLPHEMRVVVSAKRAGKTWPELTLIYERHIKKGTLAARYHRLKMKYRWLDDYVREPRFGRKSDRNKDRILTAQAANGSELLRSRPARDQNDAGNETAQSRRPRPVSPDSRSQNSLENEHVEGLEPAQRGGVTLRKRPCSQSPRDSVRNATLAGSAAAPPHASSKPQQQNKRRKNTVQGGNLLSPTDARGDGLTPSTVAAPHPGPLENHTFQTAGTWALDPIPPTPTNGQDALTKLSPPWGFVAVKLKEGAPWNTITETCNALYGTVYREQTMRRRFWELHNEESWVRDFVASGRNG